MTESKPRLAFVSPVFLFPNDAGGKIRSTNILRGLKGGAFDVSLVCPADTTQRQRWASELDRVCDELVAWEPAPKLPPWRRGLHVFGALPVNVAADRTGPGLRAVAAVAARGDIDLMVFDFVHSAVLRPASLPCASVCFTHNVEAEIFLRHAAQAKGPAQRWLWAGQHTKMQRFEATALHGFDTVVAVSERDARHFREAYNLPRVTAIPTGVDLDFFGWCAPRPASASTPPTVVFTGSMDWAANIDGVQFFIDRVWPQVIAVRPDAHFVVVGRNPPEALLAQGRRARNVSFTGFVDDVRPHVHAARVFVIPLFVGGGTRIKAFEAMAMGCPVVSTTLGMEGLGANADRHFVQRDDAASIAAAVLALLADPARCERISRDARALVEQRFGHRVAAQVFEAACTDALAARRVGR